ncbi:gpW family protein [Ochrobactrum quorumnocens]|uniref:GpW family protein n=1 Tax=Ochrobactrum quorumnocens TaxID=271865 RepID=A0A248UK62_9HYPH|nr:gpW family head-tail joining protein [[Ochrobactrum] quorumnocens]ASV87135.1 gpW family protein [[Ochrobactrum] quorumnocens]
MANREIIQKRLTEAQDALHRLLTGAATVQLSYQGESVTYTTADEGKLRNYIRELESQLGLAPSRSRARRVVFG